MALTPKQQAFVEAYDGNGTAAARAAGYKGSEQTLASVAYENLRKPDVVAAIQARRVPVSESRIASREERQAFWTATMRDTEAELNGRLKASELLGKSEADFVERHQHSGGVSVTVIDPYAKPPPGGT